MDVFSLNNSSEYGVKIEDVYDKLYDEIVEYMTNINLDKNSGNDNNVTIKKILSPEIVNNINIDSDLIKNYLITELTDFDHINEDEMDEIIKNRNYNKLCDMELTFDTMPYIINNLKSYKYDTEIIWDQFDKDCPRSTVFINNKIVKTRNVMKEKLQCLDNISVFCNDVETKTDMEFKLITLVAMICNQSSYAFPYAFMTKIQRRDDDNMFIANCSTNRTIKIETDGKKLQIFINTDVRIRDTGYRQDKIDKYCHITLSLETTLLKSGKLNSIFSDIGMFFIDFY
jgi:hypothetical protein